MWSDCSKSCNSGHQTRQRTIAQQANSGGLQCTGEPTQNQQCNTQSCPINCKWSQWSTWSTCSKTCGTGSQQRSRFITQLAQNFGKHCSGNPVQTQQCNNLPCPVAVDCQWSQWSNWSTCSKTCGTGSQERHRQISQHAESGGLQCIGQSHETYQCSSKPCPVPCKWSPWSNWSTCSTTCGTGYQQRYRFVTHQALIFQGWPCIGEPAQIQKCNNYPCSGMRYKYSLITPITLN